MTSLTRKILAHALAVGAVSCLGIGSAEAHVLAPIAMSFSAGVLHPLTGLDHLLALTAIGLWSGSRRDGSPLADLALMVASLGAGFMSGVFGLALPFVEPMILASVVVLGLLAAVAPSVPRVVGTALVVAFALFHGHAHGIETAGGSLLGFMTGFLMTSVVVAGAGHLLGRVGACRGFSLLPRIASGAVAASGLALIALS